jgi:voltage-gated potassium channel
VTRGRGRRYPLLRARNRLVLWLGPALWAALVIILGVVALSVVVIDVSERHNPNLTSGWSALHWVALAMTTERPWQPISAWGSAVGFTVDLLKPISIAVFTAAVTSTLFTSLVRRNSGMGRTKMKDHLVICGWSGKGNEILSEIRGRDDQEGRRPVTVLAELDKNPTKDDLTTFVKGDPTEARDLIRAGIESARAAIILADNSYPNIDMEDMDSRTLLTTLAVESLNPRCYTCVEVVHQRNREHFDRTKADELVVSSHVTGALLAHSAVTPGLSKVVTDLLSFPQGNEFFWIPVEGPLLGLTFRDALVHLKERQDCIAIAVAGDGRDYVTNPSGTRRLRRGDRVLVVARTTPRLLEEQPDGSTPSGDLTAPVESTDAVTAPQP